MSTSIFQETMNIAICMFQLISRFTSFSGICLASFDMYPSHVVEFAFRIYVYILRKI